MAPVVAEGRAGRAAVFGFVDELDPRAAVDVVEPQLALARALFGGDHIVAVGGPLGGLVGARLAPGHLNRVALVQRDDVDPLAATAVRGEDHAGTVGTEARLSVQGHALGERCSGAAGDRECVEVAEEVEDEGLAVGADVDRHPRALGEAGLDGAAGGEGKAFLLGVGFVFGFLGQDRAGGRVEGGCAGHAQSEQKRGGGPRPADPDLRAEPLQSCSGKSRDIDCPRAALISLHRFSSTPYAESHIPIFHRSPVPSIST